MATPGQKLYINHTRLFSLGHPNRKSLPRGIYVFSTKVGRRMTRINDRVSGCSRHKLDRNQANLLSSPSTLKKQRTRSAAGLRRPPYPYFEYDEAAIPCSLPGRHSLEGGRHRIRVIPAVGVFNHRRGTGGQMIQIELRTGRSIGRVWVSLGFTEAARRANFDHTPSPK